MEERRRSLDASARENNKCVPREDTAHARSSDLQTLNGMKLRQSQLG